MHTHTHITSHIITMSTSEQKEHVKHTEEKIQRVNQSQLLNYSIVSWTVMLIQLLILALLKKHQPLPNITI